jgi:tetratricopeptide (TPR) repeat protein
MNAVSPTQLAIRHTRMLLIKVGLNEDETDRFLARLTKEAAESNLQDQNERLSFVEQELGRLEAKQSKDTLKSQTLRNPIVGAVGGVAGNYLTRGIDLVVANAPVVLPPTPPVANQQALEAIRIEWAGGRLTAGIPDMADAWYRALKIHEGRDGSINPVTAVYLDGVGMLLDRRGDHRQAERMRRQAVKISQKVNGPGHESTAAALSNLGLTLFAQRKYVESDQCLAKGFRILKQIHGSAHTSTCAATYNIYDCLFRQGRLLHVKMPKEFTSALPEIHKFADSTAALKIFAVGFIALRDILQSLVVILQNQNANRN